MWDKILSTELKITRFEIKSEMQTSSTGTKQEARQTEIRSANEEMLVPKLEKPKLGNPHLTPVQWKP